MMDRKDLTEKMSVSPQILPNEVAALKDQGFGMLVNNRPDDEEPGQPSSEQMREAAEAAGLKYAHVPIARGISPGDIEAMQAALDASDGCKVMGFCRSGTRSTLIWSCARNEQGVAREELERAANAAGYDLAPVSHLLS